MRRRIVALAGLAAWLVATGCTSDSATGGTDQDEDLAIEFDALAREANARGDGDAGAGFGAAAMAIRFGIRPSEVTVAVDGRSQTYAAFVHRTNHTRGGSAVSIRTLVAYRAVDARPRDVLFVSLTQDSLDFIHPASARPGASGLSTWADGSARRLYLAIRGFGEIVQESRLGACPRSTAASRVTCALARFGVRVEGGYQLMNGSRRDQLDPATQVVIRTRATGVNGAILTFD
jgi:hypothetical protein